LDKRSHLQNTMSRSKKIVLTRDMTDEERSALIKKTFAGTIYEHAGDLAKFTKIWNEAQDRLQAKWKAECDDDDYKILIEKN